ncbi:MAG: hypothetical protein AAB612_00930, partial [Patescibacteria group bacterium]
MVALSEGHEHKPLLDTHRYLRLDILHLTSEEYLDILSSHFLALEHEYLRVPSGLPQMRPEAKIQFLIGPESGDVTAGIDFTG